MIELKPCQECGSGWLTVWMGLDELDDGWVLVTKCKRCQLATRTFTARLISTMPAYTARISLKDLP